MECKLVFMAVDEYEIAGCGHVHETKEDAEKCAEDMTRITGMEYHVIKFIIFD